MANLFDTPEMAAGYADARPAVHPLILDLVRKRLDLTQPIDTALDVGCGAGLSTQALQAIARHCTGIDPSAAMIKCAAARVPQARFLVGRAEAMPVPSQSMELITAAGSLNFADLDLFFPEAGRVLRPGGVLVIYDFSEGRSFRGSSSLDDWYDEFWRRWPPPPDFGGEINETTLRHCSAGLGLDHYEDFEVGLELSPEFYLEYILTETNVAQAVRNGTSKETVRAWCKETLRPVFGSCAREVLFRGYVAYLRASWL